MQLGCALFRCDFVKPIAANGCRINVAPMLWSQGFHSFGPLSLLEHVSALVYVPSSRHFFCSSIWPHTPAVTLDRDAVGRDRRWTCNSPRLGAWLAHARWVERRWRPAFRFQTAKAKGPNSEPLVCAGSVHQRFCSQSEFLECLGCSADAFGL